MIAEAATQSKRESAGAAPLIQKVAVLGAGTMGARIAAHLANAGLPVVLLDLASEKGPRSAVALGALEALKKSKPAAFYDPSVAAHITPGNFDDDRGLLSDCDWVIEAVTENLGIKQALLETRFTQVTYMFANAWTCSELDRLCQEAKLRQSRKG